jgi:hypothetical protein
MPTPVVYEDISYEHKKESNAGAVIACSVFGGLGVIAIAALIWALVRKRSNNGNAINIEVENVTVGSGNVQAKTIDDGGVVRRAEMDVQKFVDENLDFRPMEGATDGLAEINSQLPTGGLMNDPKAQDKKWDPKKMIPNPLKSVRPKGSLAERWGPSVSEMASYLPTTMDMWRQQPSGPKFLRRAVPVKNDHSAAISQASLAYNRNLKGNRARVNEKAIQDSLDIQKRRHEQAGRLINA